LVSTPDPSPVLNDLSARIDHAAEALRRVALNEEINAE
jgi:hypothetical protein